MARDAVIVCGLCMHRKVRTGLLPFLARARPAVEESGGDECGRTLVRRGSVDQGEWAA
ncbi:hypothetical protein GCM10022232_84080 [Streptomyces plumbiresistens]|uniref:Uncharacterized protein n=1 Tax=Streptomyces plumbiresistens TaxID=511811 RepID=A0ABP7TGA8_9ACTN